MRACRRHSSKTQVGPGVFPAEALGPGAEQECSGDLLAAASDLDALETLIALPTARPSTGSIASHTAQPATSTNPVTSPTVASLAVFASPNSLARPVLFLNPRTPVRAHPAAPKSVALWRARRCLHNAEEQLPEALPTASQTTPRATPPACPAT